MLLLQQELNFGAKYVLYNWAKARTTYCSIKMHKIHSQDDLEMIKPELCERVRHLSEVIVAASNLWIPSQVGQPLFP